MPRTLRALAAESDAARARATRGGQTKETRPWEPLSGTQSESAERGCDEGTRDTGTCAGCGPGSEAAEAAEAEEMALAAEGADDDDENAAPSSDVGEKRAATRAEEASFLDELD